MKTSFFSLLPYLRYILVCCLLSLPFNLIHAADSGSLIKNGDMQADSNLDGRPDRWGSAGNGQEYLSEDGNTFLRMTSNDPSKMVRAALLALPSGTFLPSVIRVRCNLILLGNLMDWLLLTQLYFAFEI